MSWSILGGSVVLPAERYGATVTDRARGRLLFLDVDGPLLPFGGSLRRRRREGVSAPHLARLRLDAGPRLAELPCALVGHDVAG